MEISAAASRPPSGSIFYQDDWGRIYRSSWLTVDGQLDVTTWVGDPYVWGEDGLSIKPIVRGHALYKRGIVTVTRQVLAPHQDGYMIVSEGRQQSVDVFQVSFPGELQPSDPFPHHLDNQVADEFDAIGVYGSRWADPANSADAALTWNDLHWIDVWSK